MSYDTGIGQDTIAACATAHGPAAIAVIRVSGPDAFALAARVAGPGLSTRQVSLRTFRDSAGNTIDTGIVLCFPAPASFTGENVVELQCHGGAVVVDWLLETLYEFGARPAEPGEFSLRAFLNDKLDLTQAEGIADLITSGSRSAAQAALRSLEGGFAAAVGEVQSALTELRVLCEAHLDFPEEAIAPAATEALLVRLTTIDRQLADIVRLAEQGLRLTDGLRVTIAGEPNAGKSSLLNRLVAIEAAIVSDVPGTTRDTVERTAVIGGIPIELTDTAGLRETTDDIETEGVNRAHAAIERSDIVLWIADARAGSACARHAARAALPGDCEYFVLLNKIDLIPPDARSRLNEVVPAASAAELLPISALTGEGIDALLETIAGLAGPVTESAGTFSARRRHLAALARSREHVRSAAPLFGSSPELAAEELRMAQSALSELTGELTSDELLGAIFSTFCIGK